MAFNLLSFYDGAKPGMKRKEVSDVEERNKIKWKKYETKRPDRKFNVTWREGRNWLQFDENKQVLACSVRTEFYKKAFAVKSENSTGHFRGQHTFTDGSTNSRSSAVTEHESSNAHVKAAESIRAATCPSNEVATSKSVQALLSLKSAERHRIAHLFGNAHFIAKHNRSLNDYEKQCILDKAKGIDVGFTLDAKPALSFIFYIAENKMEKTVDLLKQATFYSFLMDGSTEIM